MSWQAIFTLVMWLLAIPIAFFFGWVLEWLMKLRMQYQKQHKSAERGRFEENKDERNTL